MHVKNDKSAPSRLSPQLQARTLHSLLANVLRYFRWNLLRFIMLFMQRFVF